MKKMILALEKKGNSWHFYLWRRQEVDPPKRNELDKYPLSNPSKARNNRKGEM